MLVTNHVLSGALLGLVAPGPVSAFVGGVVSHFALDLAPHWGEKPIEEIMPIAVADGLTGLAVIGTVAAVTRGPLRTRLLAGMAGASTPDLDKPFTVFLGFSPFPDAFDEVHKRVQNESVKRMPVELLSGAAMAGLLAYALRRSRSK